MLILSIRQRVHCTFQLIPGWLHFFVTQSWDRWKKLISYSIPSLGPGSAVGEKGKKRGQIGEISASEASPAVAWGGRKGSLRHPFPSPDYPSAHFARWFFFLFPPMRSLVQGYSILSLGVMKMVKLGVEQYFLFVYRHLSGFSVELDLLQVDLLASRASLFRPRSGRPSDEVARGMRRRTFLKVLCWLCAPVFV